MAYYYMPEVHIQMRLNIQTDGELSGPITYNTGVHAGPMPPNMNAFMQGPPAAPAIEAGAAQRGPKIQQMETSAEDINPLNGHVGPTGPQPMVSEPATDTEVGSQKSNHSGHRHGKHRHHHHQHHKQHRTNKVGDISLDSTRDRTGSKTATDSDIEPAAGGKLNAIRKHGSSEDEPLPDELSFNQELIAPPEEPVFQRRPNLYVSGRRSPTMPNSDSALASSIRSSSLSQPPLANGRLTSLEETERFQNPPRPPPPPVAAPRRGSRSYDSNLARLAAQTSPAGGVVVEEPFQSVHTIVARMESQRPVPPPPPPVQQQLPAEPVTGKRSHMLNVIHRFLNTVERELATTVQEAPARLLPEPAKQFEPPKPTQIQRHSRSRSGSKETTFGGTKETTFGVEKHTTFGVNETTFGVEPDEPPLPRPRPLPRSKSLENTSTAAQSKRPQTPVIKRETTFEVLYADEDADTASKHSSKSNLAMQWQQPERVSPPVARYDASQPRVVVRMTADTFLKRQKFLEDNMPLSPRNYIGNDYSFPTEQIGRSSDQNSQTQSRSRSAVHLANATTVPPPPPPLPTIQREIPPPPMEIPSYKQERVFESPHLLRNPNNSRTLDTISEEVYADHIMQHRLMPSARIFEMYTGKQKVPLKGQQFDSFPPPTWSSNPLVVRAPSETSTIGTIDDERSSIEAVIPGGHLGTFHGSTVGDEDLSDYHQGARLSPFKVGSSLDNGSTLSRDSVISEASLRADRSHPYYDISITASIDPKALADRNLQFFVPPQGARRPPSVGSNSSQRLPQPKRFQDIIGPQGGRTMYETYESIEESMEEFSTPRQTRKFDTKSPANQPNSSLHVKFSPNGWKKEENVGDYAQGSSSPIITSPSNSWKYGNMQEPDSVQYAQLVQRPVGANSVRNVAQTGVLHERQPSTSSLETRSAKCTDL